MEDTSQNLVDSLLACAEIFLHLKDKFFKEKLSFKLSELLSEYISPNKNSIQDLIKKVTEILELFEYIKYVGVAKNEYFLQAELRLLKFKLLLIRSRGSEVENKKNLSNQIFQNKITTQGPNTPITSSDKKPSHSSNNDNFYRLNPNKEKILNFIKDSQQVRTKDVIDRFNLISDRTVKRNLAELIRNGLIRKKLENRAVYYY